MRMRSTSFFLNSNSCLPLSTTNYVFPYFFMNLDSSNYFLVSMLKIGKVTEIKKKTWINKEKIIISIMRGFPFKKKSCIVHAHIYPTLKKLKAMQMCITKYNQLKKYVKYYKLCKMVVFFKNLCSILLWLMMYVILIIIIFLLRN